MHMRASLDGRDHRDPYISYVFDNLHAFVVNLAPNAGISDVAKRGPLNTGNEVPACARQDHDLILSILGDSVKGVHQFCMVLRRESEGSAFGMKFSYQHTNGVTGEIQTVIGIEVVSLNCVHTIFLLFGPLGSN